MGPGVLWSTLLDTAGPVFGVIWYSWGQTKVMGRGALEEGGYCAVSTVLEVTRDGARVMLSLFHCPFVPSGLQLYGCSEKAPEGRCLQGSACFKQAECLIVNNGKISSPKTSSTSDLGTTSNHVCYSPNQQFSKTVDYTWPHVQS